MSSATIQVSVRHASDFTATRLRVEATVRGSGGAVVVGNATPDASGRCALTYDPEAARDVAEEAKPRVRLRVMAGDTPLLLDGGRVEWPYDDPPRAVEVTVGADDGPHAVTVPGTITGDADGAPLAGATVTATLTAETRHRQLAALVSDRHGAFEIIYDPATFPAWARKRAVAVSLRILWNGAVVPIVDGPRQWAVGQEPDRVDIVVDVPASQPGDGGESEPKIS